MIAAIIVIMLFFTWMTDGSYLSARNVSNLLRQTAITGILAVGMVFVIISAEIDLSVGSMMGLLGGVAGAVMGAFIMASLDNGMSMMDVPTFWQYIVKGAILLLAVWMDSATKRRA